jgi:hypothetical protein|tara:strand:- start:1190 stop:1369 length:180 start_codon:yes stop_codon:yes gene_type:complete
MPSNGEKQKSAGVKLSTPKRCMPVGERTMKSKDDTISPAFTVNNIPYKGNANLLANKDS